MIDVGWLTFQEDQPNVKTNSLANHGGGVVNAIDSDRPHRSKPLRDVATPRRFIYEALQKGVSFPTMGMKMILVCCIPASFITWKHVWQWR